MRRGIGSFRLGSTRNGGICERVSNLRVQNSISGKAEKLSSRATFDPRTHSLEQDCKSSLQNSVHKLTRCTVLQYTRSGMKCKADLSCAFPRQPPRDNPFDTLLNDLHQRQHTSPFAEAPQRCRAQQYQLLLRQCTNLRNFRQTAQLRRDERPAQKVICQCARRWPKCVQALS